MLIQHKHNDTKGMFYIEQAGRSLAEMTYTTANNNLMIIQHTEVADELRGKNVGYRLVYSAVEYARTNNAKILPLCPFAKAVFEKKAAEIGDVLKH